MTLGVTGVVWLPRTATVNTSTLLAGAGPAPLVGGAGAWQSVAAAYTDASITVGRVMAVLAAGWEGEAANAAQARLGGFLTWTQGAAAKAAEIGGHAVGEAAAYTTAAATIPNPAEIAAVKAAKYAAYSSGGALNGSAEAAELADRALDVRAGLVMEAYEAATTPLAFPVSFDRPPEIVTDSAAGTTRSSSTVAEGKSYEETSIFGFGTRTSPAQAAIAAVTTAVQNPAFASAAGQVASTAGSVAGSSVTTVASAATNIGSSAVSTLMNNQSAPQASLGSPLSGAGRADSGISGPVATRAVSTGPIGTGGVPGSGGSGGAAGLLGGGGLPGASAGAGGLSASAGSDRVLAGANGSGLFGGTTGDSAAARSSMGGGAPMAGAQDDDDTEHRTPGYLKQFEHFADGRTVAPSVIGAEPTWNDR